MLLLEKYISSKQDSEIKYCNLCLGKVSKNFRTKNMKKTGLKWSVKIFSVDVNTIDTNDILDIHKYLIKK